MSRGRPTELLTVVACCGEQRIGVLGLRVYADGNYWTAAGREDHAVPDFDEGACRGEGGGFRDYCPNNLSIFAALRGFLACPSFQHRFKVSLKRLLARALSSTLGNIKSK